jgi:ferritin-like metal-binding protein YciE
MSQMARTILIRGLRHAHAVETQSLEHLDTRAAAVEHYPEVQAQIQRHLAETEKQLERLEKCLDALGEEGIDVTGNQTAEPTPLRIAEDFAGDDAILKQAFADYAFEHYEIAIYKSLLTLCEIATQRSIVPLLQESLNEEKAMARWLKENISRLTKDYVDDRKRKAAA